MKKLLLIVCCLFMFVLTSCEITFTNEEPEKIILNVDTKKVTAESANEATWYEVDIKNSSDLLYLIITVEITDKDYLDSDYKLVVNGTEISSKKYTVKDGVLTYKMDDPNWSDFI